MQKIFSPFYARVGARQMSLILAFMLIIFQVPARAEKFSETLTINADIHEQTGPNPKCPSNFGGIITGTGSTLNLGARDLGAFVFIGSDCIVPQTNYFVFDHGKLFLTTLKGEQIAFIYSGSFIPTGIGTNFKFSNASVQIVGGTGRFKNATGHGAIQGSEDIMTGLGKIQLTGTIKFNHHSEE